MLIVVGRSCTGKDTIVKEIQKEIPRMVTYTSRPKRMNEIDGIDYHFISEVEFRDKINKGFFAEWTSYTVTNGDTWFYGSSKDSYRNEGVVILSPSGVKSVRTSELDTTVCMIDSFDEVIKQRQIERKDKITEAERRFKADLLDFVEIGEFVDFTIMNNGEHSPEFLADVILTAYHGFNRRK